MPADRKPCPCLPPAGEPLDWRALNHLRREGPVAGYYCTCLRYAQQLWLAGLSGRAILALDRALFHAPPAGDPLLSAHPLPYAALAWLLCAHPEGEPFPGNPRVHYQHLADRVRPPERALKQARAWAGWHLTRRHRPALPPDPHHAVRPPDAAWVIERLTETGLPGEAALWQAALESDFT